MSSTRPLGAVQDHHEGAGWKHATGDSLTEAMGILQVAFPDMRITGGVVTYDGALIYDDGCSVSSVTNTVTYSVASPPNTALQASRAAAASRPARSATARKRHRAMWVGLVISSLEPASAERKNFPAPAEVPLVSQGPPPAQPGAVVRSHEQEGSPCKCMDRPSCEPPTPLGQPGKGRRSFSDDTAPRNPQAVPVEAMLPSGPVDAMLQSAPVEATLLQSRPVEAMVQSAPVEALLQSGSVTVDTEDAVVPDVLHAIGRPVGSARAARTGGGSTRLPSSLCMCS